METTQNTARTALTPKTRDLILKHTGADVSRFAARFTAPVFSKVKGQNAMKVTHASGISFYSKGRRVDFDGRTFCRNGYTFKTLKLALDSVV